jgi:cell division transport system permease protein
MRDENFQATAAPMTNLLYFFREGVRGFIRAKQMTLVSIVTIATVLFIALSVGVVMLNVRAVYAGAAEKADFVVYVKDSAAADTHAFDGLVAAIRLFPQVGSATIVDKDAAWKRFSSLYGQEILAAVDGNPLPVSIEISLKNPDPADSSAKRLAADLASLQGVESVRYAREWMAFLAGLQNWLYRIGAVLALGMLITLHFTISNTIKLTIYARRDLVENMRLVGATRFFAAMPFIVEGMLQGFVGGAIAAVLFVVLRLSLPPSLPFLFGPSFLPAAPPVLGILFGWIGGNAAVRKFPD